MDSDKYAILCSQCNKVQKNANIFFTLSLYRNVHRYFHNAVTRYTYFLQVRSDIWQTTDKKSASLITNDTQQDECSTKMSDDGTWGHTYKSFQFHTNRINSFLWSFSARKYLILCDMYFYYASFPLLLLKEDELHHIFIFCRHFSNSRKLKSMKKRIPSI